MNRIRNEVYPELDSVLEQFVGGVEHALQGNFVGAYLVGSLATGDFDLDSDIDFLIVIKEELTPDRLQALGAIHRNTHVLGSYPAKHLEGSYISLALLNRTDLVGVEPLWYVDNGSTLLERSVHDNQWHVRWVLRERGIVLCGRQPNTLFAAAPAEALRAEVIVAIPNLKDKFLADIQQPSGWFSMQFGQSFAVLTCCRMLHTIQTGEVQSKLAGMQWALQTLDPKWHELIQNAWTERVGVRFGEKVRQPADKKVVQEAAAFLEYAAASVEKR
ncbi:MAG TPA: aminoglycoside adenylyltransferase domain-containing protein [Candidatus Acidoferrum sp.]|nr:aminoglycoside adenylyltransferase domain-containing protein [Candidatus Acidoferrum sp.]